MGGPKIKSFKRAFILVNKLARIILILTTFCKKNIFDLRSLPGSQYSCVMVPCRAISARSDETVFSGDFQVNIPNKYYVIHTHFCDGKQKMYFKIIQQYVFLNLKIFRNCKLNFQLNISFKLKNLQKPLSIMLNLLSLILYCHC